jgi:hypothetical protein
MAQIQMSTTNLYNRVLQSFEQRRPKTIEPDPAISDKDRQNIDFLSRLLDDIGDRLIEVNEIMGEYQPSAVTSAPSATPAPVPDTIPSHSKENQRTTSGQAANMYDSLSTISTINSSQIESR